MASSVRDVVIACLERGVTNNDEIARICREQIPGTNTTAASVSSIKSIAKRNGMLSEAAAMPSVSVTFTPPEEIELEADSGEPEEEIAARLNKRFGALDRMARGVINGLVPAMVVSGPAGIGKSWGIQKAIANQLEKDTEFHSDTISGAITAVGLYIALWNARNGGLVVLDDCDDVFRDETTLNILKAALDSSGRRIISWRKQANWLKEMEIDDCFEFKGSVIFLTNIDFESAIASGRPSAVHFKALMDRSLYLSLAIKSKKDIVVRIKQTVYDGKMLRNLGLDDQEVEEVMTFLLENRGRFYHLSLRLVHQIGLCYMADNENWKSDIEMTKMRVL